MLISFASAKQLLFSFAIKKEAVLRWNAKVESSRSLLDTSRFWKQHSGTRTRLVSLLAKGERQKLTLLSWLQSKYDKKNTALVSWVKAVAPCSCALHTSMTAIWIVKNRTSKAREAQWEEGKQFVTPAVHFLEPRLHIQSATLLQSVCLSSARVYLMNEFKLALVPLLPVAMLWPR